MRWSTDAPLLSTTSTLLNSFINTHLHEGFLPRWFPSLKDRPEKTCGFFFHGINGIIHALLDLQDSTDDDPDSFLGYRAEEQSAEHVWYSLPIPPRLHNVSFEWPGFGAISLDLYEIAIMGLDQWDMMHIFEPTEDDAFFTRLQTHQPLSIQMKALMNITQGDDIMSSSFGHDLVEDFTFTFVFDHWDVNSTLALWINRDMWETNVTAGVLLDVLLGLWDRETHGVPQDSLQCLLESFLGFQAPVLSLNTTLTSMKILPTAQAKDRAMAHLMSESLEQDLDDLLNNALQLILGEYPLYITSALAGLVDGPLRTMMEKFLQRITHHEPSPNVSCPVPNEVVHPHWLNFTQVEPLLNLEEFLKHTKTIRRINTYIQCIADYVAEIVTGVDFLAFLGSEESVSLLEDRGNFEPENETDVLRILVPEFSFRNFGQIVSLELLRPENDGLFLLNKVVYANETEPNGRAPHLVMSLALESPNMNATTNITISWADLVLSGSTLVHYDVNQLKAFGLATIFQHGHCLLAPIDDFSASTPQLDLNDSVPLSFFEISANTSVILNQGESGEQLLFYSLSTAEYPLIADLANAILEWSLASSRDIANLASLYSLAQASELCTKFGTSNHRSNDDGDDEDFDVQSAWSLFLFLAAVFVMAQPAMLLFRLSGSESGTPNETSESPLLGDTSPGHLAEPLTAEDSDPSVGHDGEVKRPALVDCPQIPLLVRTLFPAFIFLTIFILISSNVSVGATVELSAVLGEKSLHLPSVFEFSLANTAHDMWQAGIYPLFFLVVVFSGIWPYAKLCLLLFCFLSRRIDFSRRGRLLLALDSLGKFSLVDTFVLVLMMVAFRYHLQPLESDALTIDVMVIQGYGFNAFLLATLLSLVGGHLAVHYHRYAEMTTRSGIPGHRSLLVDHSFQVLGSRRKLSFLAQSGIFVLWLSAICLLALGMTRPSFVFDFKGLAGMALGDAGRREFSLVSLGASIPGSSVTSAGTVTLMAVYFFFAVVAPFACLFFLFMLLVVPMSVQQQHLVLTLAEIANAWSAVEVFCLSIVAALLEISTFASFIIGDKCDIINDIIEKYWPEDQDTTDAKCYSVSSFVKWDAGILIAGALLNSFVVSVTLRFAHSAMQDRDTLTEQDDRWSFFERVFGLRSILSMLFESPEFEHASDSSSQSPGDERQDEAQEEATKNGIGESNNGVVRRMMSWTDHHQDSQSNIDEDSEPLIEVPGSTERGD